MSGDRQDGRGGRRFYGLGRWVGWQKGLLLYRRGKAKDVGDLLLLIVGGSLVRAHPVYAPMAGSLHY